MSVSIISFAGGANRAQYITAGQRLIQQALETGLFDKSKLYTDDDLKQDPEFWPRHHNFVEQNNRGYGYYIWKSYLIKQHMAKLNDGDKLFWLDAGCEIDVRKKDTIQKYLKYIETDYIIGSKNTYEVEYSKFDLILKLDMFDGKYLNDFQRQGGVALYLVCDKTRELVNRWYELSCDYHLIDDSPDVHGRIECFKEHRHDQSIFSLLTKKYNLFSNHRIDDIVCINRNITDKSMISFPPIDFAYVTFVNNQPNYINLMKSTIKSVERFSKYPLIVYCVDIPSETNPFMTSDKCIIRNLSQRCIANKNIYYMKPYVIIDAIQKGLKGGYYIESDDLLTPNGDSVLMELIEKTDLTTYPISPIHPDDPYISKFFMMKLDVPTKTQHYIHAHVLFKETNLPFLKEWLAGCLISEGENWDESVLNCMYWKYKLTNRYLPIIDPWYQNYYDNTNLINQVVTLHGCKDAGEHANVLAKMTEQFCKEVKVSVVIPSYNRFKYLMNTIKSVKAQTHPNIEIIVVNDCSTQPEYTEYDWSSLGGSGVQIIHLAKNTKETFGYACAGFVRNQGIEKASGKYIAFCDDDDIWFPNKIELQLKAIMQNSGCKMSSTDGFVGEGVYVPGNNYQKMIAEYYFNGYKGLHHEKGIPATWNLALIKQNNWVVCSSVMIEKTILSQINNFQTLKNGDEDYDCWKRALEYTNCAYVNDICFYYDLAHGDGRHYDL